MADKKLRFALLTKWKKYLTARGIHTNINMFAQQWTADALIDEFEYDGCLEAMEYYFSVVDKPDWTWFSYNIEKVIDAKRSAEYDLKIRAELRKGAKKWLEG